MGCRLRIFLTREEKRTLEELRRASKIPQRTKDRAQVLLLNARGLKNEQIAQGLKWSVKTVRQTIYRWQSRGLVGLWDAVGRGGKPRYSDSDMVALETYIETNPRSYNSRQLAAILAQQTKVKLSPDRVRRVLKKKGWVWKRLRKSPPPRKSDNYQCFKQADLFTLKLWAESRIICLKYLDESVFECNSCIGYSYVRRGQQQRIIQSRKRGRRISAIGFWQPKSSFEYGLVVGGFNSQRYLKILDWQAQKASIHLEKTGQITVIVQDGASFHKSLAVKQHWQRWQQQGLFVFFLPPYSPQMNRIEDEWLHLKRDEIGSRIFEDEYDVAMALITGIEARANQGGYEVERFMFH